MNQFKKNIMGMYQRELKELEKIQTDFKMGIENRDKDIKTKAKIDILEEVIDMMKEKVKKQLTEKEFWEIVLRMQYSKDLDYVRIKKEFKDEITIEMYNVFYSLYSKLKKSMDSMLEDSYITSYDECIGLGEDGLSDLLSHIIGLGEDEYYRCLDNLEAISKHAKGQFHTVDGYSEVFQYIFIV